MSEQVIVKDSDNQFQLRIDGYLRSLGISQIIGTEYYLEIGFIGGYGVRVPYCKKLNELSEAIEKALLLETELSPKQIDNIRFYVNDYIEQIEKTLTELIHVKNI